MKLCDKIIVLSLILLSFFNIDYGQNTIKELRKKQDELSKAIEQIEKALQSTQRQKVSTINQLYLLKRQIKRRAELIDQYSKEISVIDKNIRANKIKIDSVKERIGQLKADYARIIRKYYLISKNKGNIIAYIISSKSVNQAYKRLKYYQQYIKYSHKIYYELKEAEDKLNQENEKLVKNRKMRETALNQLKNEEKKYKAEKYVKNRYVSALKKRERKLRKDLKDKERVNRKLAETMKKMIEEERRKNKGLRLTPEEKLITGKFDANKGKLPWPTVKGIIIESFGSHRHPVLKNVTVKNDGIDIMTEKGSYARAVFDGEVRKIVAIPGANETVIIKHGSFYTVYQNIYKVNVKVGQKVNAKEKLGLIFTNPESNETVLHFEMWNGTKKMNPETWLAKSK